MGHIYVEGHHRLAMATKLKSAAGGKEPNDHAMSKVTTTKKSALRVSCDLLSESERQRCVWQIPVGVCLQVKKCFASVCTWSLDTRRLRKRLDSGAGVCEACCVSSCIFWVLYHTYALPSQK